MGIGSRLPVCTRVSVSKPSSCVPKPPGNSATACTSFTKSSFRVKKYLRWTSFWSCEMTAFDSCSKGSMMLTPIDIFWPAPTWAPSMMPPPAPVTTIHWAAAIRRPNSTDCR